MVMTVVLHVQQWSISIYTYISNANFHSMQQTEEVGATFYALLVPYAYRHMLPSYDIMKPWHFVYYSIHNYEVFNKKCIFLRKQLGIEHERPILGKNWKYDGYNKKVISVSYATYFLHVRTELILIILMTSSNAVKSVLGNY